MITIAFYLAIVAFFVPKKVKPVLCNTLIVIFGVALFDELCKRIFGFYFLYKICGYFVYYDIILSLNGINLLHILFLPLARYAIFVSESISYFWGNTLFVLIYLIYYGICLGIAFVARKYSVIKYKSDEKYDSSDVTFTEINSDATTKLIEVSAGLCTGTLRAPVIEAKINEVAKRGWKFEQMQTIVGRCCLVFQRYKAVICFSKEEN